MSLLNYSSNDHRMILSHLFPFFQTPLSLSSDLSLFRSPLSCCLSTSHLHLSFLNPCLLVSQVPSYYHGPSLSLCLSLFLFLDSFLGFSSGQLCKKLLHQFTVWHTVKVEHYSKSYTINSGNRFSSTAMDNIVI